MRRALAVAQPSLRGLEGGLEVDPGWSMASLGDLLPLLWQLAPWLAGLMILRYLPLASRLRTSWRAGRSRR